MSNQEIAARLKGSAKNILKKLLHRLGWMLVRLPSSDRAETRSEMVFAPRFDNSVVGWTISQIQQRCKNEKIVLLVDRYTDPVINSTRICTINCHTQETGEIFSFDFANTVFVYACDSDQIGAPFIEKIIENGGKFVGVDSFKPATYLNIDDTARETIENEFYEQKQEHFDKFDFGFGDAINIIQAINLTRTLEGDYLEIGCYRGSSASVAVRYMKNSRLVRNCYFLDVFDGFNYETARVSPDARWYGTHETEGIETVSERIERNSDPSNGLNVQLFKCDIIEDDLPDAVKKLALVNIDVDMYEAIKASLEKTSPRIVDGGIIIVEDPGHTPALVGSRVALNQFLADGAGEQFTPIFMESGQTFLIKNSVKTGLLQD